MVLLEPIQLLPDPRLSNLRHRRVPLAIRALSWGMPKAVDFDFHEVCFTVAFLALALEALIDQRPGWMLTWCAALLLVKEDTPLLIAGIALVFAASRRWRWALGLLSTSIVAFALLTLVVIPRFSYKQPDPGNLRGRRPALPVV